MKSNIVKVIAAAVLFVAVLIVTQLSLDNWRADLTQEQVYSLSGGTERLLSDLEEDIQLTLYFSDKASKDLTALRGYASRVEEILEEYVLLADGKISFDVIDPEPFSEAEDQAAEAGLQAVPIATGDDVYFGLHAKNTRNNEAIIAFLQPDREAFLEYELSEMIYRLGQAMNPKVGLYSSLDMTGGFDMQRGGQLPPWVVYEQMDRLYDVRLLSESMDELSNELDLLVLVQPKELDDQALYAIDQYAMNGGKIVLFVDPHAETDQSHMMDPAASQLGLNAVAPLLDAWGVEYLPDDIVVDKAYGLTVSVGQGLPPVRHFGLLGVQPESLNPNEVVTADLEVVNFASAGTLSAPEQATTQFDALAWSSPYAHTMDVNQYKMLKDPRQIMNAVADKLEDPESEENSYVLAARISGQATSAFDQPPEAVESKVDHIASTDKLNAIVVADTDVLTDRLWVSVENFFGQRVMQPWADNGAFTSNMLEQFVGSADLIDIRSRGRFHRPFVVVEDLKLEAEEQYLDNERRLQQQLQETEQRMAELEQQRNQDSMMLSPEQEATLAAFQEEKLAIRKALRDVRHELDKDIETLGTQLKVLNIAVAPVLLTLLVWLVARWRLRR
ncbi:GldG family protein [Bermanella marisrubri]|uniref:ABC-type uncharacterized transport system involved in gliding motility, auxiliary component n=1 Tax=Bermanella marisrubri TaxID=207949 RepID=Q1N1Z2_9GAMM|nr:Gldg family protein [Bermanella marisrubri]EAT12139.1 ABC-type uncharacterized transport system involved in gliding motility, auxiliary component [Oceanobacter sp. RED65] [Bermanella marisrubri]QIZ83617.1 GldG family protein [Bermanella marisrubri]